MYNYSGEYELPITNGSCEMNFYMFVRHLKILTTLYTPIFRTLKESNTLYDNIGLGYNNNRKPDPYITERLFQLLSPSGNKSYLDIGCGTGNYTIKLAERELNFTGVDPSETMLNYAKEKSRKVKWLLGTAEKIPTPDSSFDGAIATLTIHHWADLQKSFSELHRVLKEKGKIVIFTSTPEQMKGYWLNYYFPEVLKKSMVVMPALEKIKNAFHSTGFSITQTEKYFVQDDLQDRFLYFGKNKPEIYFDENIRRGITSFSLLSSAEEVEIGLSKLKKDLQSKAFDKIKSNFENDLGDYLFIIAEKL